MSAARDLLLPGVWGTQWDLWDRPDGGIDIVSPSGRFEILKADEINSDSYKAKFGARFREIKETGTCHYAR